MKKIILSLTLIFSMQCAFCEIVIDKLPEVKYRNPDGTEFVPNSASYPKISQMEKLVFNKTFEDEPIEIRLNRLESKLYRKDYSNSPLAQRVEAIENTLDEKSVSKKERSTLAQLEKKIFNKSYENEDMEKRIERLEKSVLGANQSGNLNSRIETLKVVSSSLENQSRELAQAQQNYQNFQNPYQPQNGFKNAIRNIFGGLNPGTMTGFSPPISSMTYPQYQPYSANNSTYNSIWNNQPYYNTMPQQGQGQNFYYPSPSGNTYYQDIFKDNNGDEMYYTDGQYYKDLNSATGGMGVTIIN